MQCDDLAKFRLNDCDRDDGVDGAFALTINFHENAKDGETMNEICIYTNDNDAMRVTVISNRWMNVWNDLDAVAESENNDDVDRRKNGGG